MLFWIYRTSNRRSVDLDTDQPVPPCPGAVLLAHDKPYGPAFYTLELPNLEALAELVRTASRLVVSPTDPDDKVCVQALGATLPDRTLEVYDTMQE